MKMTRKMQKLLSLILFGTALVSNASSQSIRGWSKKNLDAADYNYGNPSKAKSGQNHHNQLETNEISEESSIQAINLQKTAVKHLVPVKSVFKKQPVYKSQSIPHVAVNKNIGSQKPRDERYQNPDSKISDNEVDKSMAYKKTENLSYESHEIREKNEENENIENYEENESNEGNEDTENFGENEENEESEGTEDLSYESSEEEKSIAIVDGLDNRYFEVIQNRTGSKSQPSTSTRSSASSDEFRHKNPKKSAYVSGSVEEPSYQPVKIQHSSLLDRWWNYLLGTGDPYQLPHDDQIYEETAYDNIKEADWQAPLQYLNILNDDLSRSWGDYGGVSYNAINNNQTGHKSQFQPVTAIKSKPLPMSSSHGINYQNINYNNAAEPTKSKNQSSYEKVNEKKNVDGGDLKRRGYGSEVESPSSVKHVGIKAKYGTNGEPKTKTDDLSGKYGHTYRGYGGDKESSELTSIESGELTGELTSIESGELTSFESGELKSHENNEQIPCNELKPQNNLLGELEGDNYHNTSKTNQIKHKPQFQPTSAIKSKHLPMISVHDVNDQNVNYSNAGELTETEEHSSYQQFNGQKNDIGSLWGDYDSNTRSPSNANQVDAQSQYRTTEGPKTKTDDSSNSYGNIYNRYHDTKELAEVASYETGELTSHKTVPETPDTKKVSRLGKLKESDRVKSHKVASTNQSSYEKVNEKKNVGGGDLKRRGYGSEVESPSSVKHVGIKAKYGTTGEPKTKTDDLSGKYGHTYRGYGGNKESNELTSCETNEQLPHKDLDSHNDRFGKLKGSKSDNSDKSLSKIQAGHGSKFQSSTNDAGYLKKTRAARNSPDSYGRYGMQESNGSQLGIPDDYYGSSPSDFENGYPTTYDRL